MKKNKKIMICVIGVIIGLLIVVAYAISVMKPKQKNTQNQVANNINTTNTNYIYTNPKENEVDTSLSVSYTDSTVKTMSEGNVKYVCTESIPTITGIDQNVANKIEGYLKNWSKSEWNDINSRISDKEIREILQKTTTSNGEENLGFNQTFRAILNTDNVITFEHVLKGGVGGVSWDKTEGVSFNKKTGEVIKISDIITDKTEYINACKRCVFEGLRQDSRAPYLKSNYKTTVVNAINKLEGYLTKNGIVCVQIPYYDISTFASEDYTYVVPYSDIKAYINSSYVIE